MKPEIANEWTEALRSGEYKQAKYTLRNEEGFCCLGVLCDIAAKHGVGAWGTPSKEEYHDDDDDINEYVFLGAYEVLPKEVMEWAGLKTEGGELNLNLNLISFNDGYQKLLDEKDEDGYSRKREFVPPSDFNAIADIIIQNVETL